MPYSAEISRSNPTCFLFLIDQSKSMSMDALLEEAKRAASLACVLLRGRVAVVGFSDEAVLSPTFDLASQRVEALRWIEGLQAIGGTKYAQALEAAAPLTPKAIVFLSDGEAEEPPDAILKLAQSRIACPVLTDRASREQSRDHRPGDQVDG